MQGLIDLSYAPHMIQIMDDLSPQSPTRVVYACFGTQLSKSTLNLILIAYRIDCRIRGPILAMHAVKEMAVAWAKDELAETIIANDYINKILQSSKRGDDAYLFKKWPGGSLITRGGASGTAFAKISASMLLIDDLDRFALNIGATTSGKIEKRKIGEGSPLELLFDRVTGRFGDYKIFANSSPKAEGESIIWPALKTTDQNHFYVKCPRCGLMQTWEFENLVIPHQNYTLTEEPYILCQNTDCQKMLIGPGFKAKSSPKVYERHKYKVLQNWEYRPHGTSLDPLTRGYRVSSLYSLLGYPFSEYAQQWLTACKVFDEEGDDGKKIRHRNTKQARPWKRKVGKSINHSALYKTRENVEPLPENCVILSLGCDLQENPGRIEAQVNGFGENDRYIIDHQIFGGDPKIKPGLEGSPWNALANFILTKRYLNCWGVEQPIYCTAIDIAWGKEEAHAKYFIQNFEPLDFQHVFGVFGKEMTKGAINFIGKNVTTDIDGFESYGMYSNIKRVAIRNLLNKHLDNKQAGNPSNLHIGNKPCFTEQWFRQLTIRRPDEKGIMVRPHDHARDEAESCMFIADAAFILAFREFEHGPDFEDFKQWNKRKPTADSGNGVSIVGNIF
jgi:phage terminase large subunit GpA-like protein